MKDERDEVTVDEDVLRRIHVRYKEHAGLPVSPAAFRPTDKDTDGISVYRALFASPTEIASPKHYVCELRVRELHQLELSVEPRPTPHPPRGHSVVPEINVVDYRGTEPKKRLKLITDALAQLADKAIVCDPIG